MKSCRPATSVLQVKSNGGFPASKTCNGFNILAQSAVLLTFFHLINHTFSYFYLKSERLQGVNNEGVDGSAGLRFVLSRSK